MIVIIDYNSGNTGSIANALERLGEKYCITSNKEEIKKAKKIIFPGVGRASSAMDELKKKDLIEIIKNIKVPFLGICLGMQLLLPYSEEGNVKCLDIISGEVKKFTVLKVPQIGWNNVKYVKNDPIFENIPQDSFFYFVNSYYVETKSDCELGFTNYGIDFTSVIKKDNFYGVQFHPEKSGKIGEQLLIKFLKL